MSKLQQLTTLRNWQKFRLVGFTLDADGLTEEEKIQYSRIVTLINEMVFTWDENNKKFKDENKHKWKERNG